MLTKCHTIIKHSSDILEQYTGMSMNRIGDRGLPWCSPLHRYTGSLECPFTSIMLEYPLKVALIMCTSLLLLKPIFLVH